ncbi:MAG: phospholipid carrier-dependent glycosyltransferase, partial [Pseudomonadota bacterium]
MTATPAPFLRADLWSSSFWCIVLVIVSLFCMLPGFFEVPGVDRDETRFSHASRQMMAEQEYIDIPFQDGKRYKKPIGIYWLQIGAVKTLETVTGGTEPPIWAYRIPSLVGAVSAVLLTFWIATQFVSPFAAGLAGMLMAISILPGFEAKIAKTDAVLLAFILLAQGSLAKAYLNREKPLQLIPWALFWGAIACGILVKGPVILLVTGATLLVLTVFDRSIGV